MHANSTHAARPRWTQKVSEGVARAIVERIVEEDLTPGTLLPPESEMVAAFDVGRASLREALRILEVHGLIEMRPGRGGGPVVAAPSPEAFGRMATLYFHATRSTFEELMDARFVIEPMMAGVAARASRTELATAMGRAMDLTHRSVGAGDHETYLHGTSEFHNVVLGLSGNRVLTLMGRALRALFAERVARLPFSEERRTTIAVHHEQIASAMLEGRADDAEHLMREHMLEYRAALVAAFPGLMEEIVDWR